MSEQPDITAASAYGDTMVDIYPYLFPDTDDAQQTADFITSLPMDVRSVLEMAVGTGRLALPIASRGVEVCGVDASPRMLDGLRRRDPTDSVERVLGDFRDIDLGRTFDVALLGLNTLFMLPAQDDQIQSLATLRKHVVDTGVVIIEAYNPLQYHRLTEPKVVTHQIGAEGLLLDTIYPHPASQTILIVHAILSSDGIRKTIETSRYAWPSELDLMARLAGLELVDRFADWQRTPFDSESDRHVSVYRPTSTH